MNYKPYRKLIASVTGQVAALSMLIIAQDDPASFESLAGTIAVMVSSFLTWRLPNDSILTS